MGDKPCLLMTKAEAQQASNRTPGTLRANLRYMTTVEQGGTFYPIERVDSFLEELIETTTSDQPSSIFCLLFADSFCDRTRMRSPKEQTKVLGYAACQPAVFFANGRVFLVRVFTGQKHVLKRRLITLNTSTARGPTDAFLL